MAVLLDSPLRIPETDARSNGDESTRRMRRLEPFHHYNLARHNVTDPVEILEERVVAMLRAAAVQDEGRDSSVAFELKHSSGVLQFGRLLAKRRQLPARAAAVGALLHDIYVIIEGRYKDHAHLGAPLAADLMNDVGGFTPEEMRQVERIVFDHSDKHLTSEDPLVEFGKDADVLDSFLYPGAFDFYLLAKPLETFVHYLARAKRIWSELSLPSEPSFDMLDDYRPHDWLMDRAPLGQPSSSGRAGGPFAIVRKNGPEVVALPRGVPLTDSMNLTATEVIAAAVNESSDPDVIMVWPQIERFEPLTWVADGGRLLSLGVLDAETAL